MKISKELQALTDKFLQDFMDLSYSQEEKTTKRDDLFSFHFQLPEAIANSVKAPEYKEGKLTCLMAMSEFDDAFAKAMFQKRIKGFVKDIEARISAKRIAGQEDYLVENIVKEKYDKEEDDFKFNLKGGKMENFKIAKKIVKAEKITFDVRNTRSGFEGKVVFFKKMKKHFKNENDYTNKMTADEVLFYNSKGEKIMDIRLNFDGKEEGTFTHYKHIADINSFYLVLKVG